MLTIEKTQNNQEMTVKLGGRLDTITAPQFEGEMRGAINGVTRLILDFSNLEYISSAGLRVVLYAQKVMNKQGSMVIRGANAEILEIFEVTGFVDILNIEEN